MRHWIVVPAFLLLPVLLGTWVLLWGVPGFTTAAHANDHAGTTLLTFDSVGELQAFNPDEIGRHRIVAITAGGTYPGDFGSETFVWDPESTAHADGFLVLKPDGGMHTGRWVLNMPVGGLSVTMRPGVRCNGHTDVSAALSNLMSEVAATYGTATVVIPPGRTCYVAHTLTVARGITLKGFLPGQMQTYVGIKLPKPALRLAPGATINLDHSRLQDLLIMRQGVPRTGPADMEAFQSAIDRWAADKSVAVTARGDDAVLDNVEIIGFNKGFYSSGFGRAQLHDVRIDGVNGVEISHAGDVVQVSNVVVGNLWSTNLGERFDATAAAVAAQGTGGYENDQVLTMSAGHAKCRTLPKLRISVVRGAITGAVMTDVGDCTAVPANPVAFAGGTGSGARFTLRFNDSNNRPGTAFWFHDRVDGGMASHLSTGGYHIGLLLSNVWEMAISDVSIESSRAVSDTEGDASTVGLLVENCVDQVKLSNVYVAGGLGISAAFLQRNGQHGGVGCTPGASAQISVTNLDVSLPISYHNQEMVYLGPYSKGQITNLQLSGADYAGGAPIVIAPHMQEWFIRGIQSVTNRPPFYRIDPSSAPFVTIVSPPELVRLDAGAALDAACNETILVDDQTAPTIHLPLTCPLRQDIVVKDAGGLAGRHPITLAMPRGATLDGAARQRIDTRFGAVRIRYDGTAAFRLP